MKIYQVVDTRFYRSDCIDEFVEYFGFNLSKAKAIADAEWSRLSRGCKYSSPDTWLVEVREYCIPDISDPRLLDDEDYLFDLICDCEGYNPLVEYSLYGDFNDCLLRRRSSDRISD